ncbi:MAG: carbamoyltransferase [Deltaproteobacteria bacterium]|nr:carbamoyltransferase [Deltaproteobacteria bacterium]
MQNIILGISAYYHDSAACLLIDGEVVAAAQEERFSRIKHDASFPQNAVKYVLDEYGLNISDLTAIAFYDKPILKFERLLETYHSFIPQGLPSFLSSIPVWIKEKLFMKDLLWKEIDSIEKTSLKKRPLLKFPEHHLSHAASAFYPSPFQDAVILTIDGVGEWATTTICQGKGNQIKNLKELRFPHSLGLLYSSFTYFCGFRVNSGEYKLMGLAPYGIKNSTRVNRYKELILEHLVDIRNDGSLLINMKYFNYATGLRMIHERKWEVLFDIPRRKEEGELTQSYMDLALAIQEITEEIVLKLALHGRDITNGCRNMVLAGGVALNCVANGKLLDSNEFDRIWIQPAAGDAGGALGAAYATHYIGLGKQRTLEKENRKDQLHGSYLGPEYNRPDIIRMCRKYNSEYKEYDDFDLLCHDVAGLLSQKRIIGWFQGRMEFGPRALGNRSILADPRDPEMQKRLNLNIKYREGFRPFAPSVLYEDVNRYFDLDSDSPYMLFVSNVKESLRFTLPDNYDVKGLYDRLYTQRSSIPAVTHVDFSARIQTVHHETNPRFWKLINRFKELTGIGLLVNTSFNVRGEPIVCSPSDAYRCFMRTEMDYLVINDFLFCKNRQPSWPEKGDVHRYFLED